jgi:hypothetical protein
MEQMSVVVNMMFILRRERGREQGEQEGAEEGSKKVNLFL